MVIYNVRIYCEEEGIYKYTQQVDEPDDTWVPEGCEEHTIRDFTLESEDDSERMLIHCLDGPEYYSYKTGEVPAECPNGHSNIVMIGNAVPFNSTQSPNGTWWDLFIDDDGGTIKARRAY